MGQRRSRRNGCLGIPRRGGRGEKCYESVAYKSLTTLSRRAELTRGFDYDELLYIPATSKYGDGGHIHSKGAMQSTFTSVRA